MDALEDDWEWHADVLGKPFLGNYDPGTLDSLAGPPTDPTWEPHRRDLGYPADMNGTGEIAER